MSVKGARWALLGAISIIAACSTGSVGDGGGGDFAIDEYPALVTTTPILVTGTKPAGVGVKVDGNERVAASSSKTWSVDLDLVQGENSFVFQPFDAAGDTGDPQTVTIALDSVPPAVTSRLPEPAAFDVPLNTIVQVGFNEPVDCATVTAAVFSLQGVTTTLECAPDGTSATLMPDSDLDETTTYTVTLFSDVADLAGNTMASDVVWNFITGTGVDNTPPDPPTADNPAPPEYTLADSVTVGGSKEAGSSVLEQGAEVVARNPQATWQYDFPTPVGTNDFSLTSQDAAGNTSTSSTDFTIIHPAGSFSVDAYPALVTITPHSFTGSKPAGYAVHVDGSVAVAASPSETWSHGLALAENDNSFVFTAVDPTGQVGATVNVDIALDSIAPTVMNVVPPRDATDIPVNATVSAVLSEAPDCSTVTSASFNVAGVAGAVSCTDGDPTIVFDPAADLAESTQYTATVSASVADPAGNTLGADDSWSFTTGQGTDTTPPDPPTIDNPAPPATTQNATVLVGGTKEAGSSVISGGATIVSKNPSPSWQYDFALTPGDNNFSLTSEDAAGNVSLTSTDFMVTRESAVATPTLDTVVSPTVVGNQVLTGTKTASTSIHNGGTLLVARDGRTTWHAYVVLTPGANHFDITAQDSGGQESLAAARQTITYNPPGQVAGASEVKIEFDLRDMWDYIGDEMYFRDVAHGIEINHFGVDIWVEGPITPGEQCIYEGTTKQRLYTRYVGTVSHGIFFDPCQNNPGDVPCSGWWNVSNFRAPNYLAALIVHGQWTTSAWPIDADVQRRDPATGEQWAAGIRGGTQQPLHPELHYPWQTPWNDWITRIRASQMPFIDGVTEATVDSGQEPGQGPPLGTWSTTRTYRWDMTDAGGQRVAKGPYLINLHLTMDRAREKSIHFATILAGDRETCWTDPADDDRGPHRAEGIIDLGGGAQTVYLKEKGRPETVDACKGTDQPYAGQLIKCNCGGSTAWPCPATPSSNPAVQGQRVLYMDPSKYVNPIGDGQNYAVKVDFCPNGCP